METELIWRIAFVIAAALFLSAVVLLMVLYRLSDEYKRKHPDRYFYDCSKDKWVRRKRKK